jgi:hypothetical protein
MHPRFLRSELAALGPCSVKQLPENVKNLSRRGKRVFNVDVETSRACGGSAKVIACIEERVIVSKIRRPTGRYVESPAVFRGIAWLLLKRSVLAS